jgi:hypothetical protein
VDVAVSEAAHDTDELEFPFPWGKPGVNSLIGVCFHRVSFKLPRSESH